MLIKDRFTRDRVKWALRALHSLRPASTEPEASLAVEIAEITHAMKDCSAAAFKRFGKAVSLGTLFVG